MRKAAGVQAILILLLPLLFSGHSSSASESGLLVVPEPTDHQASSGIAPIKPRAVPRAVLRWAGKNRPGYSFPPMEYFFGPSVPKEAIAANIHENQGWPPYCIGGDFNGDGRTDYAVILFKPGEKRGVNYMIVVLHGTKDGFEEVETSLNRSMGSIYDEIGTRLVLLKRGKHRTASGNSEGEVSLKRSTIGILEGNDLLYLVWNGKKYEMASLYAD